MLHPARVALRQLLTPGRWRQDDMKHIVSKRARAYIKSMGQKPAVPFEKLFPQANSMAIELLRATLAFDPAKRITAAQALEHPYFEKYHDPEDEPVCNDKFEFDFVRASHPPATVAQWLTFVALVCAQEFEKSKAAVPLSVWQERVWEEIQHFHPEVVG